MRAAIVSKIDLYVCAFMIGSADARARIAALGITDQALGEARAAADRAGFDRPSLLTRSALLRHFGVPHEADDHTLDYELRLWPEHYFRFARGEGLSFSSNSFALRRPTFVPPGSLVSIAAAHKLFSPAYHTVHEVRSAYGPPQLDLSWGELGEWYYELEGDPGSELRFSFDLGLLRSFEITKGRLARYGTQRS
jgi:hypothetical protein